VTGMWGGGDAGGVCSIPPAPKVHVMPRTRSVARSVARTFVRRSLASLVTLATTLALAACQGTNQGTNAPDALAKGEPLLAVEFLGGWSPHRTATFVDSAAGRWKKIRCDPTISVSPCSRGTLRDSGTLTPDQTRALFAALRAPAFQALPLDIPGGGGPEVDGTLYTLTFGRGDSLRSVLWRSMAPLPAALQEVIAHLDAVTAESWKQQ